MQRVCRDKIQDINLWYIIQDTIPHYKGYSIWKPEGV